MTIPTVSVPLQLKSPMLFIVPRSVPVQVQAPVPVQVAIAVTLAVLSAAAFAVEVPKQLQKCQYQCPCRCQSHCNRKYQFSHIWAHIHLLEVIPIIAWDWCWFPVTEFPVRPPAISSYFA